MNVDWNEVRRRLQEPFPDDAISWVPVQERKDKARALIAPYVERWRIEGRLDDVVGVENWRAEYEHVHLGPDDFKVRCRLTVMGVTKENVGEWSTLSGAYTKAFRRVAENFGIGRHVRALEPVWVRKDASGKYRPPKKHKGRIVAEPTEEDLAASERAPAPQSRKPAAVLPPEAKPEPTGDDARTSGLRAAAPKVDPVELINQLITELKNRGKGAAAARIVTKHGGYGKTPEEQRALYGELRRLLVEDTAA